MMFFCTFGHTYFHGLKYESNTKYNNDLANAAEKYCNITFYVDC